MDDVTLIREFFDEPAAPSPALLARARDRALGSGQAGDRAFGRRAGTFRARRRWTAGALGLSAVAAAVAVALSGTPAPSSDRPGRATDLSARGILLTAATSAAGRPVETGRYWHVSIRSRLYVSVGSGRGRYTVVSETRDERWNPSARGVQGVLISQPLGFRPAGPADAAAWRRAGSPQSVPIRNDRLSAKPGPAQVSSGESMNPLGRTATLRDVQALPTDPAKLKARLLQAGTSVTSDDSEPVRVFIIATALLRYMPLTPAVRAATFRVLADLPGITKVGKLKDGEGRVGTAVAMVGHKNGGTYQERLILDLSTGRVLGDSVVVVTPAPSSTALPAGALSGSNTVIAQNWTDTAPRPGN
ncbi:CU044_5270 family protein [Actinoallomurus vinaceus]|uniref:CU044_5270 family protein n=1 Tax=Actinoallomurus vinaceus TaxID=1080074 RepID=A0ABP8UGT1_9ACTN